MSDNNLAEIRNKEIGFVFQTFNLLPRATALENVILPLIYAGMNKKERNDRALQVLDQVALSDRVKHKPNELSGGQRQRVAIARALVNHPSIILADEPTGNLDKEKAQKVLNFMLNLRQELGTSLVVVTHDMALAKRMDVCYRLENGTLYTL